jgi:uncharacterized protein YxjI
MSAMHADLFEGSPTVTVSQKKEWLEILTDFERRNRFSIDLEEREGALLAHEEGSTWARFFLGSMRPYTLLIETPQKKPVLRLHAPFRFIHREIQVMDALSKPLGRVRKRFTFPHTRYDVYDGNGRHLFEIARGFVHIWTFTVRRDGQDVAVISKRWSGIGREVFTDADRFQLQFQQVVDPTERKILLGALFLIDFQHFEQSGS